MSWKIYNSHVEKQDDKDFELDSVQERKRERGEVIGVCVSVSRQMCSVQSRTDRDEPFCPGTRKRVKGE
jgi:hypothetical protein